MNWLTFYALFALSPIQPTIQHISLPKTPYFEPYDNLGFQEFQGNKPQNTFSWNLITNLKESSCTVIDITFSITEKNNLHGDFKLLYFDLKYL